MGCNKERRIETEKKQIPEREQGEGSIERRIRLALQGYQFVRYSSSHRQDFGCEGAAARSEEVVVVVVVVAAAIVAAGGRGDGARTPSMATRGAPAPMRYTPEEGQSLSSNSARTKPSNGQDQETQPKSLSVEEDPNLDGLDV